MTMTPTQITQYALAIQDLCNRVKGVKTMIEEVMDANAENDPGWNSLTNNANPTLIDSNGFIVGTGLIPTDISNAIGSLNELLNYYDGQAVPTSAWGNNIEKIANPVV